MSDHMAQKADNQIESGMNEREALIKEIEQLKKDNEKLRTCVEFYAIEACNEDWCERYLPDQDREIMDYLSGKLARQTLKELSEVESE